MLNFFFPLMSVSFGIGMDWIRLRCNGEYSFFILHYSLLFGRKNWVTAMTLLQKIPCSSSLLSIRSLCVQKVIRKLMFCKVPRQCLQSDSEEPGFLHYSWLCCLGDNLRKKSCYLCLLDVILGSCSPYSFQPTYSQYLPL